MVGIKSSLLNSSWDEYTVWEGKSITKNTPEEYNGRMVTIKDDFRVYDTIERSFADFLLFIKYASNYGKGGTPKYGEKILSIKDPQELITKVAKLGYATGSTYPTSVMKIINKHKLTKYDDLSKVTATKYVPKTKEEEKPNTNINIKTIETRKVIDITKANLSMIPANRGGNKIQFIVIHYLGVPNADNPYLYSSGSTKGFGGHYNITRKGEVYKAADPRSAVVWHCGGGLQGSTGHSFYKICTNYNSIGIECGVCYTKNVKDASGDSDQWYFTEETQESLVWLVSELMDDYGISIDHVIRHYDVTGKTCPNPYVLNKGMNGNWTWTEFKNNLAQYRKNGTITIPARQAVPYIPVQKNYLEKGDKGLDVTEMQKMLITLGYSCGSTGADGSFGNNTLAALQKFQKEHKLSVTGKYNEENKVLLTKLYKETINKVPQKDEQKEEEKRLFVAKVTAAALYVRSGPGKDYNPISEYPILKQNNLIDVYKKVINAKKEEWWYIKIAGKYFGYSNANFLQRV